MEDYELSEDNCPKCGHRTHCRKCSECDDGHIDVSMFYLEVEGSSFVKCRNCNGKGIEHWCPKCGYDLILKMSFV